MSRTKYVFSPCVSIVYFKFPLYIFHIQCELHRLFSFLFIAVELLYKPKEENANKFCIYMLRRSEEMWGIQKKRSRVSDAHHIFWAIHRSTMMMSTYKMDDIHENCFKLIRIIYFAHTLFIKMEFTNFLHELFFKRICN